MNILHLLSQNQLTGAEVYAQTLIEHQFEQGHNVYQISNAFFLKTKASQLCLDVETKSKFTFLKNIFFIRRFLRENKIHVLHAHSRAASKLAYYATLGTKVGYVSSVHGLQHSSFSKKIFNQYGQFIIAVAKHVSDQLVKDFKYPVEKIKNIPNPIFIDQFVRSTPPSPRQNLTTLNIAIIGRTTGPKKLRTELFIQHFGDLLKKNNLSAHFTLIGGSSEISGVQTVSHTEITGDLLRSYDLICGSGRVCMEAVLAEVPCIAFGEALYCGLLTTHNFDTFLESNFGDIDLDRKSPLFDHDQAEKDLQLLLSHKINLSEIRQLAEKKFSSKLISKKIIRIYESAYFLKNYSKWIPVLMYHKTPPQDIDSPHKIYVTKDNFKNHLEIFKKLKLSSMTFEELSLYRRGLADWKKFPKNPFLITFDDGYQDNMDHAEPLLKAYNYKAHIFLLADRSVNSNYWDKESHPILSEQQRQLWKNSQFFIGSHGLKHERLPAMSLTEKWHELKKSKELLESEFSQPVICYAYTYGDTNSECSQLAEEVGYEYAVNTDSGGLLLENNPFEIFRVNIFPHESFWSLWKKTRKWYRKYYAIKRNK